MLDGVHTRPQRRSDSIAADRMRRHFFADAVRFVHDGFGFFIGKIHHRMQNPIRFKAVAPVGVILNPVRSVHRLFTHCLARAVGSIHILHSRRHLELPGITKQRIHSCGGHRTRGHLHARAGHFAIGNRRLHVHVRVESVRKSDVCVARRQDRAIRNRLLEQLCVVLLRSDVSLQENVRVRINESRQNGGLRKVNHFNAGGRASSRRHGNDLVALNYDQRILDRFFAFPIDQLPGADGHAVWRLACNQYWNYEAQPERNEKTTHGKLLPQERKAYQTRPNSSRPERGSAAVKLAGLPFRFVDLPRLNT